MSEQKDTKKYESFKIPERQQVQGSGTVQTSPKNKTGISVAPSDGLFYEIEYDESLNIKGVGRFVLKSQKIGPPEKDEIRDLFYQMRDISRHHHAMHWDYSKFYDKRTLQENARVFYKQAVFIKDFTDDYTGQAEFSSYFPFYQMMGYEQLRTYFTWRTQVRNGNVAKTSLSYVFLYLYELLNNVGVKNPQDGLNKVMFFWNAFKQLDFSENDINSVNKYVLIWLKDYHIYYILPQPFKDFVEEHGLAEHYPAMADPDKNFDLYCAISKYDIRKSAFFSDDNNKLITDCFYFVINRLKQIFNNVGIEFDDVILKPTKIMTVWTPFKDALFYPWLKQQDRKLVFSENELYIWTENQGTFNKVITSETGKQCIGYVMKQMDSVLRKVTKYQFKLTANINMINQPTLQKIKESGLSLEKIINDAVMAFYREATKTVVTVDHSALNRIRQEALSTQEALTVEEQIETDSFPPKEKPTIQAGTNALPSVIEDAPIADAWKSLKAVLSEIEWQSLSLILQGGINLKQFADGNGIMLEVLADGINEKAMDHIGDNLLDEDLRIYEDYKDQIRGMIK